MRDADQSAIASPVRQCAAVRDSPHDDIVRAGVADRVHLAANWITGVDRQCSVRHSAYVVEQGKVEPLVGPDQRDRRWIVAAGKDDEQRRTVRRRSRASDDVLVGNDVAIVDEESGTASPKLDRRPTPRRSRRARRRSRTWMHRVWRPREWSLPAGVAGRTMVGSFTCRW